MANRSNPENQVINVLEGVLTGEVPFEDKLAAAELINQMATQLNRSGTRKYEVSLATEQLKGSATGSLMPAPLNRNEAESLSKRYNADAVLALEYFDTNLKRSDTYKDIEKWVDGQKTTQRQYIANALGTIKYGIRLYDVTSKNILDSRDLTSSRSWDATGNSLPEALAKLINRAEGTKLMAWQLRRSTKLR